MTSLKQVKANQENAKRSTGPTSAAGKLKVSGNRITHGILSNKLLLDDENPDEYRSLLDDLQRQLRPVGVLELSLVEKIAVILWRQRRLISAETATIDVSELTPPNQEEIKQLDWCKAVINEYNTVDRLTLKNLNKVAPLIYAQLAEDAEADEETIEEHLASTSLEKYVRELISWCLSEIAKLEKKMERHPIVAALSEKAREKLRVPWKKLDVLNKYQTTLDNQLYKAMKALREAQEWRMNSIDAIELPDEKIPVNAL